MRVVLDTSTIISALFWGGSPLQAYEAAIQGRYILLTSPVLLDELSNVLHRPKFAPALAAIRKDADEIIAEHHEIVELVTAADIPADAIRDPKDRTVLGCAVGGRADYIVTGDKDLLVLTSYQPILIMNTTEFLQRLVSN